MHVILIQITTLKTNFVVNYLCDLFLHKNFNSCVAFKEVH